MPYRTAPEPEETKQPKQSLLRWLLCTMNVSGKHQWSWELVLANGKPAFLSRCYTCGSVHLRYCDRQGVRRSLKGVTIEEY